MNSKTNQFLTPERPKSTTGVFQGVFLRWSDLSAAERVVCLSIVLLPVWWAVGLIQNYLEILLISILIYDWKCYGRLRLKKPSFLVIALSAFIATSILGDLLLQLDIYPGVARPRDFTLTVSQLIKSCLAFSMPGLIWYIQSNRIRIRLEVVAWACTVSVLQMLLVWFFSQFIFTAALDQPSRTLYGVLTGKSPTYVAGAVGAGKSNYLFLFDQEDGRFMFFFGHYQACAAFLGFTALMALDLNKRLWSVLLITACAFLITLVASRSVWIALPAAMMGHFLLKIQKRKGGWLIFALTAVIGFLTLSVTPITNTLTNFISQTSTNVIEYREGSSESRAQIYKQTLEAIPDKLFFGHKVEGPIIKGSSLETEKVGSHSHILGEMLYKGGVLLTGLFFSYWFAFIYFFTRSRNSVLPCCLSSLFFFTLMLFVTWFQWPMGTSLLICLMLTSPSKPLQLE